MIVFSLLLILVAVTLLVLGLTGGSSSFLIASIVASLLAAIALVISARQASAARRAAAAGAGPLDASSLDADPLYADPLYAEPTGAEPSGVEPSDVAPLDLGLDVDSDSRRVEPADASGSRRSAADEPRSAVADAAQSGPGGPDHAEAAAYAAGRRDTDRRDTDRRAAGRRDTDRLGDDYDGAPLGDAAQAGRPSSGRVEEPDYDRAATFIGGARAQDQDRDDVWGRDPSAAKAEAALAADAEPEDPATDVSGAAAGRGAAFANEPGGGAAFANERGAGAAFANEPGGGAAFANGPDAGAAFANGPGAGVGGLSDGSGLSEEFGEPDPDDPDDEPLPQAVRPTDAVRVAAMDAEVLVVDGRPRYHLADCAHLLGRLTEPLPVSEAVELGFSPCGLCRPVDRLVAAAARR